MKGYNGAGILGHGDNEKRTVPTEIVSLSGKNVVQLAVPTGCMNSREEYRFKQFGMHAIALTSSGTVYTWVSSFLQHHLIIKVL